MKKLPPLDDRVLVAMRVLRNRGRKRTTVRTLMRMVQRRRGEDSVSVLGAALRCAAHLTGAPTR